jgi:hypothetical protein
MIQLNMFCFSREGKTTVLNDGQWLSLRLEVREKAISILYSEDLQTIASSQADPSCRSYLIALKQNGSHRSTLFNE